MTYRGHVKNGVVVLDPPANLPEGAEVTVYPIASGVKAPASRAETATPTANEEQWPTIAEVLKDFLRKAEGLPDSSSLVCGSIAAAMESLPREDFSDWEK